MKAKIESMQHGSCDMRDLFPTESYSFIARTDGPENRMVRVEIDGNILGYGGELFKYDQIDWDFELEITIKGKPKSLQSLVVLS